jgi:hypothetical protein
VPAPYSRDLSRIRVRVRSADILEKWGPGVHYPQALPPLAKAVVPKKQNVETMDVAYLIDGEPITVRFGENTNFAFGESVCLSEKFGDLAAGCGWYDEGYLIERIFTDAEFQNVYDALEGAVRSMLAENGVDTTGFTMERYHHYVDDTLHGRVIRRTSRLYPGDFHIDVGEIVGKIEDIVDAKLGFVVEALNKNQWLISRINRPGSKDFNTAHKDIYGMYDSFAYIPKMINCWIPVCGVARNTGLPVAPGSHLVPEDRVLRTKAGCTMNGTPYSVNAIASWDGQNSLVTLAPEQGEAIVFSSHLVHGLARNRHADQTRISFEFRLYEQ